MAENKKTEKKETKSKLPQYYQAVGRRKEANCRVRLFVATDKGVNIGDKLLKKGEILVNQRLVDGYFPGKFYEKVYLEPFRATNTIGRFAVSAITTGGGLAGQLGAFVHGVSRALVKVDKDKFRPILKKKGFMTRDPRARERRKAGLAQKARAKKQSPKR